MTLTTDEAEMVRVGKRAKRDVAAMTVSQEWRVWLEICAYRWYPGRTRERFVDGAL